MQEYIKQREKEFDNLSDYRFVDSKNRAAIKYFLFQTIIGLLEQECERLEKEKKSEDKYEKRHDPRILWTDICYNQSIRDQINYYQKQIKTLKELSNLKK